MSLAAPLRQPAPASSSRRRSESLTPVPEHLNARRASTLPATPETSSNSFEEEFASEVEFGVGSHLLKPRAESPQTIQNEARAYKPGSLEEDFAEDVQFGVGEHLFRDKKRAPAPEPAEVAEPVQKRSSDLEDEFASEVEFGVGEPLLRDRKRRDLSTEFASDLEIETGVADPLIRRKVEELVQAISIRARAQTAVAA